MKSDHNKTYITSFIESKTISKDGTVLEKSEIQKLRIATEPDYVKLYVHDIIALNDLPKGMNSILLSILSRMQYRNEIYLYRPIKEEIAKESGFSLETINKSIVQLSKKNIIIQKGRGFYIGNPYLFGRGKWEDILKIRMTIEYHPGMFADGAEKVFIEITEQSDEHTRI